VTSSGQVPQLRGISGLVLTGRFLTELALLAGLAAAAVWAVFIAPKAQRRCRNPWIAAGCRHVPLR
jgi:hypothetical protein